jgi:hypothetical protein
VGFCSDRAGSCRRRFTRPPERWWRQRKPQSALYMDGEHFCWLGDFAYDLLSFIILRDFGRLPIDKNVCQPSQFFSESGKRWKHGRKLRLDLHV